MPLDEAKRGEGRIKARVHEGMLAVTGIREERGACLQEPTGGKEISTGKSGFSTFAVLDSNVEAFQMSQLFANGLLDFACVIGPSGWGKTHLLQAVSQHMRRTASSRQISALSAVAWLANSHGSQPHLPVLLDDVQEVLHRTRCRLMFQLALERRVKAGRPTFLAFTSSNDATLQIKTLPSRREWLISQITSPSLEEQKQAMARMAANLKLGLEPALIHLLASRVGGSGGSMMGALKRLKLEGSAWHGSLGSMRACGVLNPFLVSDSGWDLRDAISEAAKSLAGDCGRRASSDVAIYGMLRLANLSESDVARYSGLTPAKAYHRALDVEACLEANGDRPKFDEALAEATLRAVR